MSQGKKKKMITIQMQDVLSQPIDNTVHSRFTYSSSYHGIYANKSEVFLSKETQPLYF